MSAAPLFRALGDETRLQILERVGSDPQRISDIAIGMSISRQGVRKHLNILEDAGLVRLEAIGREVQVTAQPDGLAEGRRLIAQIESRWEERLRRLKAFVENV
ncbi:MAG: winged helix-turn-helix transcriptional regulator [Fimbriimonadaceae bacterium]|nr:winged helix-turn-helix transcriptional regulator [Fimbriimonadaceae bacterium]